MKQLGKRGKINQQANIKLKKLFAEKEITRCELCNSGEFLGFAHRFKRVGYYATPEMLSDFYQVLLLCQPCHEHIEHNKQLTAQTFTRLRGEGINESL